MTQDNTPVHIDSVRIDTNVKVPIMIFVAVGLKVKLAGKPRSAVLFFHKNPVTSQIVIAPLQRF